MEVEGSEEEVGLVAGVEGRIEGNVAFVVSDVAVIQTPDEFRCSAGFEGSVEAVQTVRTVGLAVSEYFVLQFDRPSEY